MKTIGLIIKNEPKKPKAKEQKPEPKKPKAGKD